MAQKNEKYIARYLAREIAEKFLLESTPEEVVDYLPGNWREWKTTKLEIHVKE